MGKYWRQVIAVLIGIAITPLAIATAIASASAGHGTYFMAKLLFPFTMFLSRLNGDSVTNPLLGLAFVQFPLYGLVAASFNAKWAVAALLMLHAICAVLCFSALLPNYS